jgi:hypothetical protein
MKVNRFLPITSTGCGIATADITTVNRSFAVLTSIFQYLD